MSFIYSPDRNIRNFIKYGNPLQSGMYSFNNQSEGLQDPTYLGFTLKFDMYKEDELNAINIPNTISSLRGLLLPDNNIDSAINYLKRVNKSYLAHMLKEFQTQLNNVQKTKPWYFQKITGVGELIKTPPPGQTWRGKDKKLTVECLESVDFQMSFLADLYRKCSYDMVFRKYILPIDKRRFNCKLIISEIRNLRKVKQLINEGDNLNTQYTQSNPASTKSTLGSKKTINSGSSSSTEPGVTTNQLPNRANARLMEITETLDKELSFLVFYLSDCEFHFENYTYLDNVSNSAMPDNATFNFDISIGNIVEENQYGFFKWILSENRYNAAPTEIIPVYLKAYAESKADWHYYVRNLSNNYDEAYKEHIQNENSIKNMGISNSFKNEVLNFYKTRSNSFGNNEATLSATPDEQIQIYKAQMEYSIIRNALYDLTEGEVGSNEVIQTYNIFEPLEEQKSVNSKATVEDMAYAVIRADNTGIMAGFKNVGGGYEKTFQEIQDAKATVDGGKASWKDGTFVNAELKNSGKLEGINDMVSDIKTYTKADDENKVSRNATLNNAGKLTELTQIDLKKTEASNEIGTVDLKKTEPEKTVSGVDLKVPTKDTNTSPVDLKVPTKDINVSPIELSVPTKETGTSPVDLEVPTKETNITPIK